MNDCSKLKDLNSILLVLLSLSQMPFSPCMVHVQRVTDWLTSCFPYSRPPCTCIMLLWWTVLMQCIILFYVSLSFRENPLFNCWSGVHQSRFILFFLFSNGTIITYWIWSIGHMEQLKMPRTNMRLSIIGMLWFRIRYWSMINLLRTILYRETTMHKAFLRH